MALTVPVVGRPTALRRAPRVGPRPAATRPGRRPVWREVALVGALLGLYDGGRLLAATRVTGAYGNAARVLTVEGRLHLPHEQALQHLALQRPHVVQLANAYYAGVHFPLTVAVLIWLWLRRPSHYRWARRSLALATGSGLAVMVLAPTAPPRLLTADGFVDTGRLFGQSVYGAVGHDSLANQFAAMPSFHVGWAVLLAAVLISASGTRWRWLWVLHPVTTVFVVVATGNHYWLDGVVGALLVTLALLGTRARATAPAARPPAARPPATQPPATPPTASTAGPKRHCLLCGRRLPSRRGHRVREPSLAGQPTRGQSPAP